MFLDELDHFFGVRFRIDLIEDLHDGALLVDDEGHAAGQFRVLRIDDAEAFGGFQLGVSEERVGELFLVGELLLEVEGVGADADDDGIELS